MIDFYATREHYADHLLPIWHAMKPARRGSFYIQPLNSLAQHLAAHGVGQWKPGAPPHGTDRLVVVAAAVDLSGLRRAVLVEHGAGQTYIEVDHEAWSGGPSRDRVELFVVPNEMCAAANRHRYPHTPVVICAPHVEALQTIEPGGRFDVVFGRHWDSHLAPELNSAWPHHFGAIRAYCRARPDRTALHFHPRVADTGRTLAHEWGVPYLLSFEDVVASAQTFVVDNSSAGFEWAALGRPLVWLNAPHYRRKLEQGLRFWSHVGVGIQCDEPEQLSASVAEAVVSAQMPARRAVAHSVFPVVEGSAVIAASAIEAVA